MRIGAAKICFSNPEKTKAFIKCQHFFPSSHQRKTLGELVFLTEIKLSGESTSKSIGLAEEIFEIIVNGLRTNYYTPESLKNDDVEENFENALQKLNRLIYQESISAKNFEALIKNLNAAIGLILDDKIYFSSVGSAQVFILKKNKIVDLVSEEISPTPARVFSQIISGNLEKDDTLFFSTANFLDYFVFEKLSNIANKFSTQDSAEKLKELLKNLKDKISVGAILMKKERKDFKESDVPEAESAIMEKEEPKEQITPANLKITKPIQVTPLKVKIETTREDDQELKIIEEKTLPLKKETATVIKKEEVKEFRPEPAFKETKARTKLPKVSFGFIKKLHFKLPKIKLPTIGLRQFKVLPLIIIILLAFFLINNIIKSKNQEQNTLKFFTSLQEIQSKNALLNAALTYGDTKKVNALVEELKTKIDLVKTSSAIEKELISQFKSDFQKNTDKIYGVTRIEKPIIFADLNNLPKKQGLKKIITLINGQLIILNQITNEIYQYDQQKKIASLVIKINYTINKIIAFSDHEILIIGENKIELLDLQNKKTTALKIETSRKSFLINDAEFFDNKLYLLDTKANQIFKYLKADNGFNKEIPWLNEKVNLEKTSSLAIDGSIYLLKDSGEILKFFMGKSQKMTFDSPYPPLTKPTKIFATPDLNNIYILEPSQKRIMIYGKDGKIKKQIISETFTDLKDICLDQKETKIFVLNKDQVIEIGL